MTFTEIAVRLPGSTSAVINCSLIRGRASSPLRRYVDLVNQRQVIALAQGTPPAYRAGDERLLAIMREFESAYEAYGDFQRSMERYWCLRWLLQERVHTVQASVLRDNLVRFDDLPLVARVASLPSLASGRQVLLDVTGVDLLELSFHCEFRRALDTSEHASASPSALAAAAGR